MKSVLLFSGGWDSIAAYYASKSKNSLDLLFVNYGQLYLDHELESARKFAHHVGKPLSVLDVPNMEHDNERRNFLLLAEAKKLKYQKVVTGSRNLLPWFDRYRDSNYLYLKIQAHLLNMEVELPVLLWRKQKIVSYVQRRYSHRPYNCYNNSTNFKACGCVNCEELRGLGL